MPTVATFSRLAAREHLVGRWLPRGREFPRRARRRSVREPSAASLPAAVSICLAVLRRERVLQVVLESVTTFCCRLRARVADDRVERPVPVRREQLDLLVGGPAECRHDIAQVGDLPLEGQQHGCDHQEAENDRDPVLGAPGARDGRRRGGRGCGVGEGLFGHGTSPGDVREDARDHEKDEDDGGGHSPGVQREAGRRRGGLDVCWFAHGPCSV